MLTKKSRVRGNGPSRKELKAFQQIGTASDELIMSLKQVATSNQQNDLGTDKYNISSYVDSGGNYGVRGTDKYRQVLLQTNPSNDHSSEKNYTQWEPGTTAVKELLSQYFRNVYRFRISVMQPDHTIDWHIDTDTSVICRGQLCIDVGENSFDFDTKKSIETLTMTPGGLYFINTGWNHRVVNVDKVRICAIFSFDFDDVIKKDILWL